MRDIQNILNNKKLIKLIVIFYHLLFCFFTLYYTISFKYESDAERIFRMANNADSWRSLWGLGTVFTSFLIYPLIKIGFNYIMLTVLFSFVLSCVVKKKYITIPFVLAGLLALLNRPYLLVIVMFAYCISFLFNSKIEI